MRKWEDALIEEIDFQETKNGGRPSRRFDQTWFDENGAIHVTFES